MYLILFYLILSFILDKNIFAEYNLNNNKNLEVNVMKVTKDMGIMDVVQLYPDSVPVFEDFGMHCFGCMAARFENIEQGCYAHGIDPDVLIDAINEMIGD